MQYSLPKSRIRYNIRSLAVFTSSTLAGLTLRSHHYYTSLPFQEISSNTIRCLQYSLQPSFLSNTSRPLQCVISY